MKTVVCFGASLTAGTVSFNYLDLLSARPLLANFRFVNHGVNSDLAWNGLNRLDKIVADRPDFVTILIGTNDVNATLSERNLLRYKALNHLPEEPTLDWYETNLRKIVQRLKQETHARLALLSLAVLGENLEHEANRKIDLYNEVVRHVAESEGVTYLPLHEKMVVFLREHEPERAQLPPRLEYRDGMHNTGHAFALHDAGLSWDDVSRRNGLMLTTDCIHLNSVGAGMIADLIEEWLLAESVTDDES